MERRSVVSRRRLIAGIGIGLAAVACRAPAVAPGTTPTVASEGTAQATSAPGATSMPGATPVPGQPTVAAVPPAPSATVVLPTPTVDDRERVLRLTLGDRAWSISVRGPAAMGLEPALQPIATDVAKPARDARLRINKDGTLEYQGAAAGMALDVAATAERVRAAVAQGRGEAELVTQVVPPGLRDEQLAGVKATLEKLLGRTDGPVATVKGADKSWTLDKAETADLLAFDFPKTANEPVKLVVDEWPARAFVGRVAKAIDRPASEARFAWNGGKPKPIREGSAGRVLDQEAALKTLERTLAAGERNVELPVKVVEPTISTADVEAFTGAALIESGSTALGGAIPEKRHNVKLAAERLNGAVVAPGGTFSFNSEVGPTSLEAGYKWGFGITSGSEGIKTVPSVAGGICQVATTLFQPVFWAGYPLEERYWHLYWIPSYASKGVVGLDVTVDADYNLDFKWINASKTPVLIQASADDQKITFQLYGKKPDWTVKVDPAKITNRVPPDTTPVTEEEPTLPWGRTIVVEAAREGFDAEVVRRVFPADGGEPRVLTLKSNYQPSRTVTLVGTAGKPANATAVPAPGPGATGTPATNRPAVPTTPQPVDATPSPAPAAPAGTPVPAPSVVAPAPTVTPARPVAVPTATRTVAPAKPAPGKPGRP